MQRLQGRGRPRKVMTGTRILLTVMAVGFVATWTCSTVYFVLQDNHKVWHTFDKLTSYAVADGT